MRYTPEETKYIVDTYCTNPTIETIDEIAAKLNRNRNQIVGKLSKEGVYKRKGYLSKLGEVPVTKLELVQEVADITNIPRWRLEGLDKAPKMALKQLLDYLRDGDPSRELRNSTEESQEWSS